MTEISRPWNGNNVLGDDGPYSDEEWQEVWHSITGNDALGSSNKVGNSRGVIKGALNELRVQEQAVPDATVRVRSGYGNVNGAWYYNDADVTVTPNANASGSTRIDVVVLQADFATNTVRIALVEGTPAAGYPALTQTAGTLWETPLAALVLLNGFATINDTDIVDMRRWTNVPDSVFIWVQNNSAAVMQGGDVAVWDSTVDSSITSTTTPGAPIAGIVEGYIPVSGWGRVQTQGIGWVNLSDAVARADYLSQGETALKAGNYGGSAFARALTAGVTSEQVLSYINVPLRYEWREGDFKFTGRPVDDGWLYADSETIGDASSGADFADTRYLSLFYELWTDYLDAELPILTSLGGASTRGASAAADWALHKRMTLPYLNGRAAIARDNQGGTSANVITDAQADLTGGTFGEETHTLTVAELAAHTHTLDSGTAGGGAAVNTKIDPTATTTATTNSTGSDDPHNNVQPSFFAYWQIKI